MLAFLLACQPIGTAVDDAGNPIWNADITLDADFTVAAGETLTIEPGVTVTLAEGAALLVDGELVARGTAAAPVVFTGDAAARWRSIVFNDAAVDAAFDGVDVFTEGSIVEHAVVEHATRGMELAGASPYLHAVTFRNNELPATVDTVGGAALLVSGGATPRIRNCVFEDNVANNFAFGGALYVDAADPIVQDSVFTGNTATYGGAVSTNLMAAPIVGSRFEGNVSDSEGGAISLVSTVAAVLANTVTGNVADTDGGGVHVCVTCDPHASPYFYDDVITDNVSASEDPDDGAAGLGAAYLGAFANNDVHGNLRNGEPSDFSWFNPISEGAPDWIAAPALSSVWWGTDDPAAIAATIWDGADNARYGAITLDAIRTAPLSAPTPRAVIASRRLHYQDAGEVPVFLTVYNPGAARTATLAITRNDLPFSGEMAYPGATRAGDGWTLALPENSVWFTTLDVETYDGVAVDDIAWEAILRDEEGELLGVPVVARYLFGPAE